MAEEFSIGQIFEAEYPPEAAVWCNEGGVAYIDEIEPTQEGVRRFQIVAVPEPTLEEVKAQRLSELNAAHEKAEEDAHVVSSLGFTVDADDRANRDVEGLLKTMKDGETVSFCDYLNQFHELTKAELETLQVEIIQNAQRLYSQKWAYRTQIESAESADEVRAISFDFTHLAF